MCCWELAPPPATPGGHWGLLHNFGENPLLKLPGLPLEERRSLPGPSEDEGTEGGKEECCALAQVDVLGQPRSSCGVRSRRGAGIPRSPEH